jgi:hypothetical protein
MFTEKEKKKRRVNIGRICTYTKKWCWKVTSAQCNRMLRYTTIELRLTQNDKGKLGFNIPYGKASNIFFAQHYGAMMMISQSISVAWVLERTLLSYRHLSAKLVPTFANRGCRVVSVADLLRPYSRFSIPEPLLFLSSSPSIVLTRLSGLRSRPTTTPKIC